MKNVFFDSKNFKKKFCFFFWNDEMKLRKQIDD